MNIKIIVIWVLACLSLADSVFRLFRSNFNFGTFLMYLITALLWIYAIFNKWIDIFCAHGLGRILKYMFFGGCGFLLIIIIFLAVSGYTHSANHTEKALIVLGAGLRGENVSGVLRRRLDAAAEYYDKNSDIIIIVSGGKGRDEIMPESTAMKKYLLRCGIPENVVFEETKSTSTRENFSMSADILKENGIDKNENIAFVTNNFHCYRASVTAKRAGYGNIFAVPASTGAVSVLPCYLREAFAVLHTWVFNK
ncbi:MAG: YdcF family protein [Oscillospiraceae bacterium]